MRLLLILVFMQLAFVFGSKSCSELFRFEKLISSRELEASLHLEQNITDLNFYDYFEISITFTKPVKSLTVTKVLISGESGLVFDGNGGVTSSTASIASFESVDLLSEDQQTFKLRKNWGNIDIRSTVWKIIIFSIEMKFQSPYVDVSRVVLNNRPMCNGRLN